MTTRVEPVPQPNEREALEQFLDYFRATLREKAIGLSDQQAREMSVPPSPLSLAGLLRHMAEVERHWFQMYMRGDDEHRLFWHLGPDADFEVDDTVTLDACLELFDREVAMSRSIAANYTLDNLASRSDHHRPGYVGWTPNLRWILVHMIEEYARHAGHADLLRERIDGLVGD